VLASGVLFLLPGMCELAIAPEYRRGLVIVAGSSLFRPSD